MNIKVGILILSVLILVVLVYLGFRGDKKIGNLAPGTHEVKAKEVIQTNNYTYVRVSDGKSEYWCALNKTDVATGKTYYWLKGWEMNQFHSKELNRTFTSIFFLETLSDKPILNVSSVNQESMPGRQAVPEKQGIKFDRSEGSVTIAELYANRKAYDGKSVKVQGEVVKFSGSIMNRNWVHIQDGTKDGNNYDLVVTTLDSVSVGNIVILEGVISANKDFGVGYNYEVIMEDAKRK